MAFGRNLKRARHRLRLSRAQVAERAGVSRQNVRRLELGRVNPGWEVLAALCQALGVGLGELVGEEGGEDGATGRTI